MFSIEAEALRGWEPLHLSDRQDPEEDESNGIDGEVGKHMHQPRAIDRAAFLVEPVKQTAAHKQSCQRQEPDQRIKPAGCHAQMIEGKERWAEAIGKGSGGQSFQGKKRVTAEEKALLEEKKKEEKEQDSE